MQFHEPSAGEPVAQHRDSPTAGKVGEKRSAPCFQAGVLHLCTKEANHITSSGAAASQPRVCDASAALVPRGSQRHGGSSQRAPCRQSRCAIGELGNVTMNWPRDQMLRRRWYKDGCST